MPADPATTEVITGALEGVTALDSDEYVPVPDEFTAAILKVYAVPFVKPVTVALRAVLTPSLNVVHVPPAQYWMA